MSDVLVAGDPTPRLQAVKQPTDLLLTPAFEWRPGEGPDPAALERLCKAFPRPRAAMGEAWFMGKERKLHTRLTGDLDGAPVEDLMAALGEIATGTIAFGPADEWSDWLHYLLPRLVPRAHETFVSQLLESLVTALFAVHPRDLREGPYADFGEDILATLGRCLMARARWPDGALDPHLGLNRSFLSKPGLWFWNSANGPLSASLFLCLKYLRPEQIGPWLRSAFAIEDPRWRALVMSWLLGAHPVLGGTVRQPDKFEKLYPDIQWEWSHSLNGRYPEVDDGVPIAFIPAPNLDAAMEAVRNHFTEAVVMDWVESLAQDLTVAAETDAMPLWFLQAYFPSEPEGG